jgi:hypothetical protein
VTPIVYLPQACDDTRGPGVHKPARQPYQPLAAEDCAGGAPGLRHVAAGNPPRNRLIMRGIQRMERNPRSCVVEMDMYNNIKVDMAATIKRRINPPRLSMGFSNGRVGQLLRKSRGITTVLQISLP